MYCKQSETITCNQVCRVCTECTVPHPSLMTNQRLVQSKFMVSVKRPNFDACIRRTSSKISGLDKP